jgi:SAM-dependent methyltransferase
VGPTTCPCGATSAIAVLDTRDALPQRHVVLECSRCRLRRFNVEPSAEELARLYDGYQTYSNPSWVADERARRRPVAERLLRKLARALAPAPLEGRFLEVGCASGGLLWNLARISRLDCHGVEIDPQSGKVAAEALPGRVTIGSLEDAGFPADYFTAAYLEQVIEHVPDTPGLFRELRRVLRPGGVVIMGTPNFRGLASRLLGPRWKEFRPIDHVRMFSPPALRWFLENGGFADVRVATGGFWLLDREGRDRLPVARDGLVARVVARGLGALRLGDVLTATARKPS